MGVVLLAVLILLLLSTVPAYPYSRSWGYYPSGGVGLLLIALIVLLLMGFLPWWTYAPGPVGPVTPLTPP